MPIRRTVSPRALVALVALLGLACGDATGPDGGLASARARWERNGPPSYEMTIEVGCYCGWEPEGPVVVVVRDGRVESRTHVANGAPVAEALAATFPDVPGLFAVVADAQRRRAANISVSYHPADGHPTHVAIDYVGRIADDEISYRVHALRPR